MKEVPMADVYDAFGLATSRGRVQFTFESPELAAKFLNRLRMARTRALDTDRKIDHGLKEVYRGLWFDRQSNRVLIVDCAHPNAKKYLPQVKIDFPKASRR